MVRNALFIFLLLVIFQTASSQNPWPRITSQTKPWTRWWWMSSAVDEKNLDKLLTTYSKAGFGGVEITPIYGAVGYENRYIPFLSPRWMQVLNFTVTKAKSVGMGVDMNAGTGWPFGGPQVKYEDAASKLILQSYVLEPGKAFNERIVLKDEKQLQAGARLQAAVAYGDNGEVISVMDKIDGNGKLNWAPPSGKWQLYAAFCGKTLQAVKRAAAGGEGLVMNHLDKKAVDNYLKRFDSAFHKVSPGIRAFFNDSYEVYNANWSPGLFDEFKKRRGYDLSLYLKYLQENDSSAQAIRIKSDYRETMSEMLLYNFAANWAKWAYKYKSKIKYQAHGSPGNLLDLYAVADIPECEAYFGLTYFPIPGLRHDTTDVINPNSNANVFKFASSAANVYGQPLISSETLVWLTEHFKTELSQCKPEVERMFLNGVNHVFFHGTAYSPEDVGFPGWQFYASSNISPSNSWWSHLNGLNSYIARCQSVLQSGQSDNDLMVYWPVYDCWSNPKGVDMPLTIHNTNVWLNPSVFNKVVTQIQGLGYTTDFVSDNMLFLARAENGKVKVHRTATSWKAIIIPECNYMPGATLGQIIQLAKDGATIILQGWPKDVPGLKNLDGEAKNSIQMIAENYATQGNGVSEYKLGKGKLIVSQDIPAALEKLHIQRETLVDAGLQFVRRAWNGGKYYYIVNHSAYEVNTMLPIHYAAGTVTNMDPLTGLTGIAKFISKQNMTEVYIQLKPGQSIILKASAKKEQGPLWKYSVPTGSPIEINGKWTLQFKTGGPYLPAGKEMATLQPWTAFVDDSTTQSFSGTAVYSTTFNLPSKSASRYLLQLSKVYQSAKVFINGKEAGICWSIPFEIEIGRYLKPGMNTIDIEVANLMANRIRNMDRNKQVWRKYHEINFVNINYKPFDASGWKVEPSGLEGPITIQQISDK